MYLRRTYVRPKVEFNTPVWSPFLLKDITKIEKVQRYFTKIAFNKCSIPYRSYSDRLKQIGYLSLQQRRLYFDLVLLFKMMIGISDLNFRDYFSLIQNSYSLRSHPFQVKPLVKMPSSQWQNSFFGRVSASWNILPENVVCQLDLNSFKHSLKAHLKSLT